MHKNKKDIKAEARYGETFCIVLHLMIKMSHHAPSLSHGLEDGIIRTLQEDLLDTLAHVLEVLHGEIPRVH